MIRSLPQRFLLASLTAAGCFAEPAVDGTAGGTGAPTGEATSEPNTGGSGDVTAAATDASMSGTTSSTTASDSGDTSEGTDDGADTGGSGSGSESGSGSDTTRPAVCPTFFDTFDDAIIDPRWRQSHPSSALEADGELTISVTGQLNDQYVTMVVLPEDGGLEGGAMRVELGTPPVEMGVRTTLWVQPTEGAGRISYNLASRSGGLRLEARITPELGSPTIAATLDWDPRTMGWLQLREEGGMLYFEISADGVSFETFHEMTTPFDVSSAEVGFAGHNDDELGSDVEVSVRSFEFICG